ncbi:hypothetical protein ALC60_14569, partial [Trachymyrmex zeteki]
SGRATLWIVITRHILIYLHFRDKLEPHSFKIRIQGKGGLCHWLNSFEIPSKFYAWWWCSHEITSILKSMRRLNPQDEKDNYGREGQALLTQRVLIWRTNPRCNSLTLLACLLASDESLLFLIEFSDQPLKQKINFHVSSVSQKRLRTKVQTRIK